MGLFKPFGFEPFPAKPDVTRQKGRAKKIPLKNAGDYGKSAKLPNFPGVGGISALASIFCD